LEEKEVFAAVNLELNRVFRVNYKLPNNPQNYSWLCIECKKPLFYNPNLNCFKHRGQKPEGFEPETVEHKTMKDYWYHIFPLFNSIKSRTLEYWLGDQIADVYFELRENGEKIAIECQNSPISSKKIMERTAKYTNKGIYVLWVFNASGSVVSEEKFPQNSVKVRVLKEETRVHNLYTGRIYYMNVVGEEVISPPYAIHFSPYFEYKKLEGNIYGRDKYYRGLKNAVYGNIPTYKIVCSDYTNYKLARFMDKNMSILCTDHLKASIREFCVIKMIEGELDNNSEFKIPVDLVIDQVKDEFGYYLPYLLLKRSKKIKKVKFERLLDERYKIQDILTVNATDYL